MWLAADADFDDKMRVTWRAPYEGKDRVVGDQMSDEAEKVEGVCLAEKNIGNQNSAALSEVCCRE